MITNNNPRNILRRDDLSFKKLVYVPRLILKKKHLIVWIIVQPINLFFSAVASVWRLGYCLLCYVVI